MTCICGIKLSKVDRYCRNCGEALNPVTKSTRGHWAITNFGRSGHPPELYTGHILHVINLHVGSPGIYIARSKTPGTVLESKTYIPQNGIALCEFGDGLSAVDLHILCYADLKAYYVTNITENRVNPYIVDVTYA